MTQHSPDPAERLDESELRRLKTALNAMLGSEAHVIDYQAQPFKGGEPVVHHERAARALERLGILCYDVAKPMKECGCQETVFTNSLVGTKTGGRPTL